MMKSHLVRLCGFLLGNKKHFFAGERIILGLWVNDGNYLLLARNSRSGGHSPNYPSFTCRVTLVAKSAHSY
jgi:hypothetical protein